MQWVVIAFSRGSSPPGGRPHVSSLSGGRVPQSFITESLCIGCKKGRQGKKIERLTCGQVLSLVGQYKSFVYPNSCFLAAWHSTHTLRCTHAYAHTHIHRLSHICMHPCTPLLYTPIPPHAHIQMCTHLHTQVHAHTHTQAPVYPDAHTPFFKKPVVYLTGKAHSEGQK